MAKKNGVPFVIPPELVVPPALAVEVSPSLDVPTVIRRYSYKITVPTDTQHRFNQVFGSCRFVFNRYLDLVKADYAAGNGYPGWMTGIKTVVTEGRKAEGFEWLKDAPIHTLGESVRNADRAMQNFFASMTGKRQGPKVGFPRFKKRSSKQSATFDRTF